MQLPRTLYQHVRPARPTTILLVYSLFTAPPAVGAQEVAPVGAVAVRLSADTSVLARTATHEGQRQSLDGPLRIGAGLLGSAAGVVIGGVAGAGTASGCHGELCELGPALLGAAIGSVAIAAMASAAPQLGSTCSAGARLAHGVVGGVTGAVTGGALGLVGGPLCIVTYLAGAGIGAGWAVSSCGRGG